MNYLIFGASGGIGLALVERCLHGGHLVTAVSRQPTPPLKQLSARYPGRMAIIHADILNWQATDIRQLEALYSHYGKPDFIINAIGLLHQGQPAPGVGTAIMPEEAFMPEKKLQQIEYAFFQRNMQVNCFSSIVIAQYLASLYHSNEPFGFAALSAMVGSISDNQSGGWYSYRMSKAALNMFIKTLGIEWKRCFPKAYALAIHPGTTDTPLSEPFQRNIASDKLYPAPQTAERILAIVENAQPEQSGSFLFWDGRSLNW